MRSVPKPNVLAHMFSCYKAVIATRLISDFSRQKTMFYFPSLALCQFNDAKMSIYDKDAHSMSLLFLNSPT